MKKYWNYVQSVKEKSPLVHNITNYVVMNNTANALLAAGASPVMAHAVEEVADMVKIAGSLVINIGTLSENWIKAMKIAIKQANSMGKPVVIDPVGAGATPFRNSTLSDLLQTCKFTVIRGNASEIKALFAADIKTKGVDSTDSTESAYEAAGFLNKKYGSIICVSGDPDIIISENKVARVKNGHPMMAKVTGMGCISTALIGAFMAVVEDKFDAVGAAMALMGVTGELALEKSSGPASLQANFIDKLFNITEEEFLKKVNVTFE